MAVAITSICITYRNMMRLIPKILGRSVEYSRPYRRVRPTPYVYNGLFGATRSMIPPL